LLLLDANVVIRLFEIGLWNQVLDRCEVFLSRTVIEQEVRFYHGKAQDSIIDLSASSRRSGFTTGRLRTASLIFRNCSDVSTEDPCLPCAAGE
jgi:hypothetical protein